jgi:hypothetical protein
VAIVLMVNGNSMAADAAPQRLPDAFDAHEVIVAESIDDAVVASSQRAPDLILLPSTLLPRDGKARMAGLLGRVPDDRSAPRARRGRNAAATVNGQWIYWFGSTGATRDRSSAARRFLELARQCLGPIDAATS